MKIFALVLYICSGVANTCLQPFVFNDQFDSAYDCMITGYDESKAKMIEIGPEDVNKYGMFIKVYCVKDTSI